jgi:hypothetical protein
MSTTMEPLRISQTSPGPYFTIFPYHVPDSLLFTNAYIHSILIYGSMTTFKTKKIPWVPLLNILIQVWNTAQEDGFNN